MFLKDWLTSIRLAIDSINQELNILEYIPEYDYTDEEVYRERLETIEKDVEYIKELLKERITIYTRANKVVDINND